MRLSTVFALLAAAALQARSTLHRSVRSNLADPVFAKANGTMFNIDGVTKYYAGSNSYWLTFQMNNADIDKVLDNFVASGLKIFRIWGFNDVTNTPDSRTVWFQSFAKGGNNPTINTGANGLQRLDYVVKAAEQRGVKLIINFVNNWKDYGGMAAYTSFFGGGSNPADWYTNEKIQTQYQTYIKAVVSRYRNSTAVFAWELSNEARCKGCSTDVIYNWAAKTSKYVKSLDPNHMVTLGDEGFGMPGDTSYPYGSSEGLDWKKNLAIDTIDFGTYHLYPSSWSVSNDWGNSWIKAHAQACIQANKPCLFEEYGITSGDKCSIEGGWQKTALSTAGTAGDLFWDWGDTLSTGRSADDGNTIFYNSAQWTCLVKNHVSDIKARS